MDNHYVFFWSFIMLTTASTYFAEECPAPEEIYPCKCTVPMWLKIECSGLESVSTIKSSLSKLKTPLRVVLLDLKMKTIPQNFLQGVNVISLIIVSDIESIDLHAFRGLENSLEMFILSKSRLKNIFHPAFKDLLKKYNNENTFSVNTNNFDKSPSIKVTRAGTDNLPDNIWNLALHGNGIQAIEEGSFHRFNNLKLLALSKNNLTTLNGNVFPSKLKIVFLDFNKFTEIPMDAFSSMERYLTIWIGNNTIRRFPSKEEVKKMLSPHISVFAYGNPLNCTCASEWYVEYRKELPYAFLLYGQCAGDEKRKSVNILELAAKDFEDCS